MYGFLAACFQERLAQWLPSDVPLLPQGEGDQGKRMLRAIISMFPSAIYEPGKGSRNR